MLGYIRGLTKAYYKNAGVKMVEDSVAGVVAANLGEYRADVDFRMAAYERRWDDYQYKVEATLQKLIDPSSQNYTRIMQLFPRYTMIPFVVHLISQVYASGVDRTVIIDGDATMSDDQKVSLEGNAQRFLDKMQWGQKFAAAERVCNLCNSALVWLVPGWGNKIECRVVEPSRLFCLQHPEYPNNLDAAYGVAIELPSSDDGYAMAYTMGNSKFIRYLRTDDGWTMDMTDAGGRVLRSYTADGLLASLPIVKIDSYETVDLYPRGGDDILAEPLAIARKMADLDLSAMFSAYPQMVVSGMDAKQAAGIHCGPGSFIAMPDADGKVEWLSGDGANIKTILDCVMQSAKLWMATYGIPPSEFETEPIERSGIAKYQARQPLYERRAEAAPKYVAAEAALWPKAIDLAMWMGDPMGTLLAGTGLSVDIKPPSPVLTEAEVLANWQQKINAGIKTNVDYLVEVNGMTRDDALIKVRDDARASRGVTGATE